MLEMLLLSIISWQGGRALIELENMNEVIAGVRGVALALTRR